MRLALLLSLALVLAADMAAAKLPAPKKPKGGYEVVVSGTGTLELNLASPAWACGGNATDKLLLKGVYRSTLAPKSAVIHRARGFTKRKGYGPWGTVAGFSVSGTSDESYNDYSACPPLLGTGAPAVQTCNGSATKTLSGATHQLSFFHNGKAVQVALQTEKGDTRTDGFPGPAHSCALNVSEESPLTIFKSVRNSKFAGKKGSFTLRQSAPVAFERLYGFYPSVKYSGTATYELNIEWRRVSRGPKPEAKKPPKGRR